MAIYRIISDKGEYFLHLVGYYSPLIGTNQMFDGFNDQVFSAKYLTYARIEETQPAFNNFIAPCNTKRMGET
jgi:hypothetical protein